MPTELQLAEKLVFFSSHASYAYVRVPTADEKTLFQFCELVPRQDGAPCDASLKASKERIFFPIPFTDAKVDGPFSAVAPRRSSHHYIDAHTRPQASKSSDDSSVITATLNASIERQHEHMTLYISSVTPLNYLAFFAHAPIYLNRGVTLVLGKNNTGKTSLLRSLALQPPNEMHTGILNVPTLGVTKNRTPEVRIVFEVSAQALRDMESQLDEYSVLSTRIDPQGNLPISIHRGDFEKDLQCECALAGVGNANQLRVAASYMGLPIPGAIDRLHVAPSCTLLRYRRNPAESRGYDFIDREHLDWPQSRDNELSRQLFYILRQRVFRLVAERRSYPTMKIKKEREVSSDAANLVAVLDLLHSERRRFSDYEKYVQKILPEIGEIRIQATDNEGEKEIRIAMAESVNRTDLTFGLSQLGSGTTQVLALVHAITMSELPRIIVIDELSTFLHPGATREVLRLVAQFPQHQYVIATHATTALDVLPTASLLMTERGKNGEATVRAIEGRELGVQRSLLQSLGVSLQDVFGVDHVVWVEGPTEVAVFRRILAINPKLPRGVTILPIVNVGDLENSTDSRWAEIYRRLSSGGGLIPAQVSFVLDCESRSPKKFEELNNRTSGRAFFMDEIRMTENMFLDSAVVAEFLSSQTSNSEPVVLNGITEIEISNYWKTLEGEKRYKTPLRYDVDPQWKSKVHAAQVLADTCLHFSNARLTYDKIKHGAELTEIAFAFRPELLQPAIRVLERALGIGQNA